MREEIRPIDANALIRYFDGGLPKPGKQYWYTPEEIVEIIKRMPTVVWLPVVRCGECEWWQRTADSMQGVCALGKGIPTEYYYCGSGKRKEKSK